MAVGKRKQSSKSMSNGNNSSDTSKKVKTTSSKASPLVKKETVVVKQITVKKTVAKKAVGKKEVSVPGEQVEETKPVAKNYEVYRGKIEPSPLDGKLRCWGNNSEAARHYHDEVWGTYPTHHSLKPSFVDSKSKSVQIMKANAVVVEEQAGQRVEEAKELFARLCLQMMQAGLSWSCVMNKIPHFYAAFSQFDYNLIAQYTDQDRERLMACEGIIRNKAKINAIITNAVHAVRIDEAYKSKHKQATRGEGFVSFIRSFDPAREAERLCQFSATGNHMRSDFKTKPEDLLHSDGVHPSASVGVMFAALKKEGFKFVGPTTVLSFMQATGTMNHHRSTCFCYGEIEEARKKKEMVD